MAGAMETERGTVVYPVGADPVGSERGDQGQPAARQQQQQKQQESISRLTPEDVAIRDLGRCRLPSPVAAHLGADAMHFVGEADKVLVDDCLSNLGAHAGQLGALPAFELAGPAQQDLLRPAHRCGPGSSPAAGSVRA